MASRGHRVRCRDRCRSAASRWRLVPTQAGERAAGPSVGAQEPQSDRHRPGGWPRVSVPSSTLSLHLRRLTRWTTSITTPTPLGPNLGSAGGWSAAAPDSVLTRPPTVPSRSGGRAERAWADVGCGSSHVTSTSTVWKASGGSLTEVGGGLPEARVTGPLVRHAGRLGTP